MLALTDSKRFEKVYQYFPIRGHWFLPNDRDIGVIKKIAQSMIESPSQENTLIWFRSPTQYLHS